MANYDIAVRTYGLLERVCAGRPLRVFKAGARLLSPRAGDVASAILSGASSGAISYKANEFDLIRSSALYLRKNISNARATFTFKNGALDVKYS